MSQDTSDPIRTPSIVLIKCMHLCRCSGTYPLLRQTMLGDIPVGDITAIVGSK